MEVFYPLWSWMAKWQVQCFLIFIFFGPIASGQIRYSISEEMEKGSFVGDITKDLGLDVKEISTRKGRIVSENNKSHFQVNYNNGVLFIKDRIDREELCGQFQPCILEFQFVIEKPLELHHTEVEIKDINDNAPTFAKNEMLLQVQEVTPLGSVFFLQSAQDPDVGTNALQNYQISYNEHFYLEVRIRGDGSKFAELVLKKPLDRERVSEYNLILTATDGGSPQKSGSAHVHIVVLDVNDNFPVFSQELYKVSVLETVQKEQLILVVNATDLDEGSNGEITYFFPQISGTDQQMFKINPMTGEIRLIGVLDFEGVQVYELDVQATDGGGLSTHCKVLVEVLDVNDNAPVLVITSVSTPLPEDSPLQTVVALFSVKDLDSNENGKVSCFIREDLPFVLKLSIKNFYQLTISKGLDREKVSEYNITITAIDSGSPPISSLATIQIKLSDVNDNAPTFNQTSYAIFLKENNKPGHCIGSIQAFDIDYKDNAHIIYSVVEKLKNESTLPSFISINSENGNVYARHSFNFEVLREFHVSIVARDCGSPPLSSTVTVKVIILDENDNSPYILYPSQKVTTTADLVPRSADIGYLVTKVIAVDADSAQNAWLSYHIMKATDPTLFTLGSNTGEIRTARLIMNQDRNKQIMVILVEDNGQPALSTTVTLRILLVESLSNVHLEFMDLGAEKEYDGNLTMYLIMSLSLVSFIFLASIAILIFMKICRYRKLRQQFHTPSENHYTSNQGNFPPNYLDAKFNGSLIGTLPHNYCYEVRLAAESVKKEFNILGAYSTNTANRKKDTAQDQEFTSATAANTNLSDKRDLFNEVRNSLANYGLFDN
ncbi:protocadherin beta-1-like [Latimeria chalumnae]|uniref:protocadherin beta-1-like n=1 Tax=Latimeria chalumnae TaxID=7897 RepID=UPI0006D91732|nr:PREDICTED: protocadherin beta-1-like [Latimeria chalumnae]|eukprot:XP_014343515.1 PREDICTED: protocadherin beta-1-like [Latimeria chalumnae]